MLQTFAQGICRGRHDGRTPPLQLVAPVPEEDREHVGSMLEELDRPGSVSSVGVRTISHFFGQCGQAPHRLELVPVRAHLRNRMKPPSKMRTMRMVCPAFAGHAKDVLDGGHVRKRILDDL